MNKNRLKFSLLAMLLASSGLSVYAQSPGGIATAPAAWYLPQNATDTTWADASSSGLDLAVPKNTTATVTVNAGDAKHNFNAWTTGYSNANYYVYDNSTNAAHSDATNAIFGTWGDNGATTGLNYNGGYYYMPITIYGVARATSTVNGLITGIDNEFNTGSEPGLSVTAASGNVAPRFYRWGNGIDKTATTKTAELNETGVYYVHPYEGDQTASANNLVMGLNGNDTIIASQSGRSSVAGPFLKVGYDGFSSGAFSGDIQEVIWFKATLTDAERMRVNSYLAVKYGSTLAHSYINAGGDTIFSFTTNSGYTSNIAGVERDDASGLYQKQSNSVNKNNQILIGMGGLANTNIDNTGTLSDGQALVWGDNGLAKTATVAISNVPGTNYRFAAIWKAQNSGAVGTVRVAWPQNAAYQSIKLVQSTDASFASGNTVTDMTANTVTINGTVYNYADVTLADGEYFTIAVYAQTPGGVGMPVVWLKADAGADTATLSGHVSALQNYGYSGGLAEQIQSGATTYDAPYYQQHIHNFNPSLVDSVTNANGGLELKDVFPTYEQRALSTFVLQDQPDITQQRSMISFVNQDNFAVSVDLPWFASQNATQLYFWWDGSYANVHSLTNGLTRYNNIPTINSYHRNIWTSNPDTTFLGMNGAGKMYVVGNSSAGVGIGQHLLINADGGNNNPSGGNISEVIVYDRDLTATERLQVNSYMAIKYGITLYNEDGTNATDYLSSAATVVWDTTVNDGYNNNIGGIAYEQNSGLNQKQSASVNSGQQVLIGTTGLANANDSNTVSLTDDQFLIWGDNGMERTPSVAIGNVSGINFRFASVWKVQNTGSVGTVRIAWPQNAGFASFKLVQSADPAFASGNTATDMTANTLTVNGVVYNYADVTLSNGEYFTFGVRAVSPGGIATLPAVWYRPDNVSASEWKDASINSMDLTTQDTSATYSVDVNNGNQVHNFHTWATGFTNTKYFSNRETTNSLFGTWGDNGVTATASADYDGGYYYMPLTVFGVARDTLASNGTGAITGIDNDQGYGAEPGFGIYGGKQSFYRWGNGADVRNNAAAIVAPVNASAVYLWRPPAGGSTASGNDTLLMGTNGAYSKISINRKSSVAGPHINIGTDNFAHPSGFEGSIQEVIWYKDSLSISDIQKVETYLALKYGSTLAHDYINAAGDTVYNIGGADSNYRYNVAGIGAEVVNGGLDQRQSNSVNTGKQVLISTTGLANTNDSNTTSLTEGQYLVWGDNGDAKSPAVAISGISDINFRFGSVWKVENTANVGTVRVAWPKTAFNKFVLIQNSDAAFATGNTATDMTTNIVTVNGVQYQYADVTLADGQYFTFGAYVQAPGGVADGLMMWHKADDSVTVAGPKDQWMDFSGNGMTVTQLNDDAYRPTLVTDAVDSADNVAYTFNFNPFYHFDGSDFFYKDNAAYFPATTSGGSSFSVSYNSAIGGFHTIYGWGDDDPNLVRGGDDYYAYYNNGSPNITKDVGATTLNANIAGMLWKPAQAANADNAFYFLLNGQVDTTSNFGFGNLNDANNFAIGSEGFGLTGSGNERFTGGIAEVFAYSKDYQNDTTDALQRINSYLAIKYGITLKNKAGTATSSYLSSQSDTVWNAADNIGYNNNIAGLAHDVPSALDQKQSVSENTNMQQVLIGTLSMDNTNSANMNSLSDGQFLLWGDNGAARSPSHYNAALGHNVNLLFASVWKAQNTGTVGTVRVAWPQQFSTLSLVQSSDTTFDNSDTYTDMTVNTITVNGIVYNYADVTLSDGQYFTFATKLDHAPGGVFEGLSLWYRADKDAVNTGDSTEVTSWTDFAAGIVANQVGTNDYPLYHEGSASYLNFNPGINFTGANQSLGNLLVQTVQDTAYDLITLTKEGITAGGANARVFSVLSSRSHPSGSIHYWDGIGLNYDSRIERYNTSSGLSYLGNPGNINFASNSPSIMNFTFTDNNVAKGLNGAIAGTPANSGPYGIIDGGFTFGSTVFSGNGSDNYSLKGSIGETIVYGSRNLSSVERNKVNSYLAIKYGITMDTASSYITADSTLVWDKNADHDFYHNIAGIGRDDVSALFQKQSRSQITNNPNNEVAIGLGGIYATNFDNTDSIANGQFLVWGDNGNTQAMTNTASSYAAFTYNGSSDNRRMKRVWKVRNTNVDKTVKLRFPIASVGTTTITGEDACSNYAIVYASDSGFTSNVVVAPLNVNGTDYEALRSFPQGASYFTFAKVLDVASGIVVLPASTQTTTEYNQCATDGWRYFNQSGVPADKLLAMKGLDNAQLDNLTITVSPTGANYDDGNVVTRVMPRVSTVTDASAGTYSGVNVRVYYSDTELSNTQLPGAITDSWIKYEGAAADAIADIQDNGVFTQGMASELTPDSTGMEDGVRFAEFHNVSSFSSFLYVSSSQPIGVVLPIRLLSFTAVRNNQSVLLNWATASEENNKGFAIEHSTDGVQWAALGFVNSKAENGNSVAPLSYAYTDAKPVQAKNFYRLKEVSLDGKYEYSEVRTVDFNDVMHISVYPNPVKESVTIAGLKGNNTIYVSNSLGQVIIRETATQDTKNLSTAQLVPGVYMITVQGENNSKYNFKMVKQ